MRLILAGAMILAALPCWAQTPAFAPASPAPARAGVMPPPLATPAPAAASTNPAISAGRDSATLPAKGRNSFTAGQATRRLESENYRQVTGLRLDRDGVWRGQAMKDGKPVTVWLDYRGDAGHG